MRRGEIRWVDLEPIRGAESDKRRPAVIVQCERVEDVPRRSGAGLSDQAVRGSGRSASMS